MTPRIGIFGGLTSSASTDEVVAGVRTAQDQGFASYWVPQVFGHDALTLIAVAGRETGTSGRGGIELGTAVVPAYPRHPVALAAQALTVQHVTGGRLTLGIGLSHEPVVEHMFGMSFDRPLRYMREYLDILMPLVEDRAVSSRGEVLSSDVALDLPATAPVPVVVAALGPRMLALAGARTAGTITWMTGPQTIETHTAPAIRAAAEGAGNPEPRVACCLPICVTDDVDRARERASKAFSIYGQLPSYRAMLDREGVEGPADVAIVGGEGVVEDRVRALGDAGVTDFVAVEFGSGPDEARRTRDVLRSLLPR
jgi:5,10-methylenetetrahydromethanopterin reductase